MKGLPDPRVARHTAALAIAVAAVVAVPGRAADRPWTLIRGEHAAIIGQQSSKTLREVALKIEQFRAVIGGLIPNAQRPLPVPTVVYVFDTVKELRPFLPLSNGKPASLGGIFHHDGEVNYIALELEGFEENARIVFHEYTHLLLRNATQSIPVWLNEGLAEYYSTYTLADNGKRADIGRPIPRHVAILRQRLIPITQLIGVERSSELYNEGERQSIFYAEAWALTHYLMIEAPTGPASINAYVAAIAAGESPDRAFTDAFGMAPAAFDKVLRSYVSQPAFRSLAYTFSERVQVTASSQEQIVSAPESEAWLGDLQRRVNRIDEAAVRIEASVKAAPAAAMPHLALALLRLSQQRRDEAWPSFDRAAALAPDDFLVQYTFGVNLLRERYATGSPGETAGLERALAVLKRAAAVNPISSEVFAWLAYANMIADGRVAEARIAITRAVALAPGRLDYRLRSADIAVLEGKLDEAGALLTQLAAVTFDAAIAEGAKMRLERVEEHKSRAAARAAAMKAATADAATALAEATARRSTATTNDRDEPRETEDRRFKLRTVQRNEQRAYGDLTQLECTDGRVRFHLRVGSRDIVAGATRMEAVELTNFSEAKDFTVACGKREPPDAVYLTWRLATPRTENGSTIVGEAIAVEFVPRGYTPRD
jgi:tetratricopeptide (TPR) repeat protein